MSITEQRLILCDHCDAIHRLALHARSVHCTQCGLEQPIPLRDNRPLAHPHSPMHQMSAATYFAMLRDQDGQPAPLPPHLAPLVEVGELAEARVIEAQAQFRNARLALRRAPTAQTREDVYWLALLLSQHHLVADDLDRQRAVLETALDLVANARHRQVLRCMLGMSQAAAGDLEAAEAWIAPCDPKSGDLQADSALRVLAAFVATARSDRAEVLRHLGDRHDAIPIDDAREAEAAVLRANALEKSGRLEASVQTLMATIDHFGPFCHRQMESFAALHPQLMLCAHSFPAVTQRRRERVKASPMPSGTPLILLAAGLFSLGLTIVTWREILVTGELPTLPADSESNVAGIMFVPPLIALFLVPMGFGALRDAWVRRRIVRRGVPATARLLDMQPTGVTIDDVPQMRLRLQISRPGHAPHTATSFDPLSDNAAAALKAGNSVAVLVDPDRPEHAIVER